MSGSSRRLHRACALALTALVLVGTGCRCQCSRDDDAREKPVFVPGTPGAPPADHPAPAPKK